MIALALLAGILHMFLGLPYASGASAAAGADIFRTKCAACHGADASGNTAIGKRLSIRDLRSSEVQERTDEELTAILTKGKAPMPAFAKTLSAADINDVVAYLRSIARK
jgi:cytochrome c6